jgi:hypothetical protein
VYCHTNGRHSHSGDLSAECSSNRQGKVGRVQLIDNRDRRKVYDRRHYRGHYGRYYGPYYAPYAYYGPYYGPHYYPYYPPYYGPSVSFSFGF